MIKNKKSQRTRKQALPKCTCPVFFLRWSVQLGVINPQVFRSFHKHGAALQHVMAAGCWLLACGCWWLNVGCWFLAPCSEPPHAHHLLHVLGTSRAPPFADMSTASNEYAI